MYWLSAKTVGSTNLHPISRDLETNTEKNRTKGQEEKWLVKKDRIEKVSSRDKEGGS